MYYGFANEGMGIIVGKAIGYGAKGLEYALQASSKTITNVFVTTPYGKAIQAVTEDAIAARSEVESGAKLYRLGTLGKSEASEAQFWSLESPLANSQAYAKKYGVPIKNIKNADFIEVGTLKPNTQFITRPAPAAPGSPIGSGGGMEVVTPANGVKLESFNVIKK